MQVPHARTDVLGDVEHLLQREVRLGVLQEAEQRSALEELGDDGEARVRVRKAEELNDVRVRAEGQQTISCEKKGSSAEGAYGMRSQTLASSAKFLIASPLRCACSILTATGVVPRHAASYTAPK